jgi:hypothetical protein
VTALCTAASRTASSLQLLRPTKWSNLSCMCLLRAGSPRPGRREIFKDFAADEFPVRTT